MADPTRPWWEQLNQARNWQANQTKYPVGTPVGMVSTSDPSYQTWLMRNFTQANANDQLRTYPSSGQAATFTARTPTPTPSASTVAATGNYPSASTMTTRSTPTSSGSRTEPGQGDDWDGFASRYNDVAQDLLFSEYGPYAILGDYLGQDGRADRANLQGDLARYADAAPMLYDILMEGSLDPKYTGDDDVINWMAELFGNMTQDGGRAPSTQQLMNAFFAGLGDKGSNLYLKTMVNPDTGQKYTTQETIRAINKYIPFLTTFTGNYNYADGLRRQAAMLGNEYAQMVANDKAGGLSYADFLKRNLGR